MLPMEKSTYLAHCQPVFCTCEYASHLPFQPQPGAWNDHVPHVVSERLQRISHRHRPNAAQLPTSLPCVVARDEACTLQQGHIGPVDPVGIVAIVRLDQVVENLAFVVGHLVDGIVVAGHVRPMRRRWPVILNVRHLQRWTVCPFRYGQRIRPWVG